MALSPELLDRFAAAAEIIREREQLRTYECDGLTGRRVVPSLVALPASDAQRIDAQGSSPDTSTRP